MKSPCFYGGIRKYDHRLLPSRRFSFSAAALPFSRYVAAGRDALHPGVVFLIAGISLIIDGIRYTTIYGRIVLPILALVLCGSEHWSRCPLQAHTRKVRSGS